MKIGNEEEKMDRDTANEKEIMETIRMLYPNQNEKKRVNDGHINTSKKKNMAGNKKKKRKLNESDVNTEVATAMDNHNHTKGIGHPLGQSTMARCGRLYR